jgi:hypothetical protein
MQAECTSTVVVESNWNGKMLSNKSKVKSVEPVEPSVAQCSRMFQPMTCSDTTSGQGAFRNSKHLVPDDSNAVLSVGFVKGKKVENAPRFV